MSSSGVVRRQPAVVDDNLVGHTRRAVAQSQPLLLLLLLRLSQPLEMLRHLYLVVYLYGKYFSKRAGWTKILILENKSKMWILRKKKSRNVYFEKK